MTKTLLTKTLLTKTSPTKTITALRSSIRRAGLATLLLAATIAAAAADETITVGGSRVALIRPASVRASVILLPGGDGAINVGDRGDIHGLLGNQLVRTRNAYAARGLAVMVADYNTDLKAAVDTMAATSVR